MTENKKLCCPFCGVELEPDPEYLNSEYYHCENMDCIFPQTIELHFRVWQKMIDGKRAQDALKVAQETIDNAERFCSGIVAHNAEIQKAVHHAHFLYRIPHFAALLYGNIQDSKTIIASITKQEDKE